MAPSHDFAARKLRAVRLRERDGTAENCGCKTGRERIVFKQKEEMR